MQSFASTIAAIDAAIASLNAQLAAGTQPVGVASLSVSGKTITYFNLADGILKLTEWRMQLETYQNRQSKGMFSRTRVSGGGRAW